MDKNKHYLTSREYWNDLKYIRSLCQEYFQDYDTENRKVIVDDIYKSAYDLSENLKEVFELEDSRRFM